MFGGHRSDDVGDVVVRHRPQHPLTDQRVRGIDDMGGDDGIGDGEHFGGGFGVEPVDQRCESGLVEMMNGRQGVFSCTV